MYLWLVRLPSPHDAEGTDPVPPADYEGMQNPLHRLSDASIQILSLLAQNQNQTKNKKSNKTTTIIKNVHKP